MDSVKNCQKPSAGYRNAEHLSMLCDRTVAERIQISTGSSQSGAFEEHVLHYVWAGLLRAVRLMLS